MNFYHYLMPNKIYNKRIVRFLWCHRNWQPTLCHSIKCGNRECETHWMISKWEEVEKVRKGNLISSYFIHIYTFVNRRQPTNKWANHLARRNVRSFICRQTKISKDPSIMRMLKLLAFIQSLNKKYSSSVAKPIDLSHHLQLFTKSVVRANQIRLIFVWFVFAAPNICTPRVLSLRWKWVYACVSN